jgi:adenylate cyclase
VLLDRVVLTDQAVVPVGTALAHLVLCLYVILRRSRSHDAISRLFIAYLFLTALWNGILALTTIDAIPVPLPGLTWAQLVPYGLIILGVLYWTFARAGLQRSWVTPWGWVIGLIGLALLTGLDMAWFSLPAETFRRWPWIATQLNAENADLTLGVVWWALYMGLIWLTIELQRFRTQSPAHRNRISYLLLATVLLFAGYGMYLVPSEVFRAVGLITTWLGGALGTYIVIAEDLLDLGTGVRRTISALVVALVTIAVYLVGIYVVQTFLGAFLESAFPSHFLDPVLSVAAVTAVLLAIVYTPIRRLIQGLTNRILFGQRYDYQAVIHGYGQAISGILYLDELANVALTHIKQALRIDDGVLLILDTESNEQLHFRSLPLQAVDHLPETLPLTKDTPIIHRLADEGQPLAQYTIDISPQFKCVPEQECAALRELNLEWFIPILKKDQLIGIFALGPKKSRRRYSAEDMRLLTTLADQTALALENAALVDRLQRNLEETTHMKNLMDNVFDSMEDGVLTTDVVGRITLFNKAAESILALSPDDCIGLPYVKALPWLVNTVLPTLIANVLSREERYTDYEIVPELPDRGKVNLNVSLAPLKDTQDQTQGVTMVVDDLTETKRLQAAQDMFRRYVSPAVVDRLPADPSELRLGGHRQEVTILFADLRGFTELGEKLEPEKLVDMLNEHLSIAATAILMYEGTLDKFMGDAVMGIFNAPLKQKDHALRAVRAASAMQKAIADHHRNVPPAQRLSFGVGLHIGEAVVGNVGTSVRMDYTVIGDTVNLAKRIQENAPAGRVLMSEAVYEVVKDSVKAVFHKEMAVKGREQPVVTYELQL